MAHQSTAPRHYVDASQLQPVAGARLSVRSVTCHPRGHSHLEGVSLDVVALDFPFGPGQAVGVTFDLGEALLFDGATGRALP